LVSLCRSRVQSSSCRGGRQPHPTRVSYIVVIQRVSLQGSKPSLRLLQAFDSEIDPHSAAAADRTPIQIPWQPTDLVSSIAGHITPDSLRENRR